jgi:oligopeptide/dipeptide ABC transporter ATP-binding protein
MIFAAASIDEIVNNIVFSGIIVVISIFLSRILNSVISSKRRVSATVLWKSNLIALAISYGIWTGLTFALGLTTGKFIRMPWHILLVILFFGSNWCIGKKLTKDEIRKSLSGLEDRLKKKDGLLQLTEEKIGDDKILLSVEDLVTYFYTEEGIVKAVEGVTFQIYEDEVLGLVGETGCGKSVTALSVLQLIRPPGEIVGGKVLFQGKDLLNDPKIVMQKYRGNQITMIFQDPLNSLNPVMKVGDQIIEVFLNHKMDELYAEAGQYAQEMELIKAELVKRKELITQQNNFEEDKLKEHIDAKPMDSIPHEVNENPSKLVKTIKSRKNLINLIATIVLAVAILVSIPYVINASFSIGTVWWHEPIDMILYLGGLFIAGGIYILYNTIKNAIKKSFIQSKKIQNLRVLIFIIGAYNLIITLIFLFISFSLISIPWIICGIFIIIAGFLYQKYSVDDLMIGYQELDEQSGIFTIARDWAAKIIKDVGISDPDQILDRYPHELSGGMRQRVMIAIALSCSPKLLIADEPTTALDVTIQAQILELMKRLQKEYKTSILMITHDLGLISELCDRVAVMYSGYIVEYGSIYKLFKNPLHPYTHGLILAIPRVEKRVENLMTISGMVPNLIYPPSGCRFHPRCKYRFEPCDAINPEQIETEPGYFVACHLYDPKYKDLAKNAIDNSGNPNKIMQEVD